jgi:hypothetical protein
MVWSKFDLGWPWLCLGGGLVLFTVLLSTNAARSDLTVSRWRDPVWLAWLVVPMLMVHMFEEYAYDILGRTYFLPEMICKGIGYAPYPDCPIPIPHYPLLNLAVAWVTAPIAAVLARRNLVIGLTFYGLLVVNGLFHLGGTIAMGLDGGTGVITGTLFFTASFCWMVYVVLNSGAMSVKALAVSIAGGVIGHALIPVVFGLFKAGAIGAAGVYVGDIVIVTIPLVVAWVGSSFLGTGAVGRAAPA